MIKSRIYKPFKDRQILIVDNDCDSRDLYAFLLEDYGTVVTRLSTIKGALDFLENCTPTILICEIRFLGESVYPLIQRVRSLSHSHSEEIPVLAISTSSLADISQQIAITVEAYLMKPIDTDFFLNQVWDLILPANINKIQSVPKNLKLIGP